MSKRSLIACSLTPACFHHDRSKSRMSMSCSLSCALSPVLSIMKLRVAGARPRAADLGEQAAGEMGLGHTADPDPVSSLAHGQVLCLGEVVNSFEAPFHDQPETIVD